MLSRMIARLRRDDRGQDLIEYTLLMAFLALAVVGLFAGTGGSVAGIWSSAGTTIAVANGAQPGTVTAAPGGGGGSGGDHGGDHGDNR